MITGTKINKKYGSLEVLKDVDFQINKGEVTAIVGPSGAGKSTLLQIIGTIDKPDSGNILFGDMDVTKLNSISMAKFRNKHIGFIFQFHHLLPELSALENVAIPAMIGGTSKSESEKRGKELLDNLGLSNRLNHRPGQLSGGEQQRVSVARALMNNPEVILADEPSGNLDSNNAKALHQLFFDLRDTMNQTFIIVTHNEELANMANTKFEMKDGIIVSIIKNIK